jgi:uncharacterized protein
MLKFYKKVFSEEPMAQHKLLGEERRKWIIQKLKESGQPIKGSELASLANVSRQVIVNDITLLKARNEPIIATSEGYLYFRPSHLQAPYEKVIAVLHQEEDVEKELMLLVKHGVIVKDVKVEHGVYGDISAPIMVSNEQEVKDYMRRIKETKARFLLQLTDGVHLHTIASYDPKHLEMAERALKEAGFLLTENARDE